MSPNAMRLATSMNSPSRRGDPFAISRKIKRPATISREPFTDSHAVSPVDGGGESAVPKAADAGGGANQKREPRNKIASAIRPERTNPIWTMGKLLSFANNLAPLEISVKQNLA